MKIEIDQLEKTQVLGNNYIGSMSENAGKLLCDYDRKINHKRNFLPDIDFSNKYWKLIKVLKTQTSVCRWLIRVKDFYIVVISSKLPMYGDAISFFQSDKKGIINLSDPLIIFGAELDLENAVDRFSQLLQAALIEENGEINGLSIKEILSPTK